MMLHIFGMFYHVLFCSIERMILILFLNIKQQQELKINKTNFLAKIGIFLKKILLTTENKKRKKIP